MGTGIGGHTKAYEGKTDVWLTPPGIIKALGQFDLDPCSPIGRPWDTAAKHYTVEDDGLLQPWAGRVWMNPPYGPETSNWMSKLADHGDGVALIFARTETAMFFSHVWPKAASLLFIEGRLFFHDHAGVKAKHNSGGPSVLIAYDLPNSDRNSASLAASGIKGQYVDLRRQRAAL